MLVCFVQIDILASEVMHTPSIDYIIVIKNIIVIITKATLNILNTKEPKPYSLFGLCFFITEYIIQINKLIGNVKKASVPMNNLYIEFIIYFPYISCYNIHYKLLQNKFYLHL